MKCENCGIDHDGSYGSGRFCGTKCARGFSTKANREEINKKVSNTIKSSEKAKAANDIRRGKPMTEEAMTSIKRFRRIKEQKFLNTPFEQIKPGLIKKRILLEQNNKCNHCSLEDWQGKPITLELEHKDGNHQNNDRDNLECICPNCHSQTKTFRGRNKRIHEKGITDKDVVTAYLETGSLRQALLKVGLAAKGSNYGRIKRALTLNGVDYVLNNR